MPPVILLHEVRDGEVRQVEWVPPDLPRVHEAMREPYETRGQR